MKQNFHKVACTSTYPHTLTRQDDGVFELVLPAYRLLPCPSMTTDVHLCPLHDGHQWLVTSWGTLSVPGRPWREKEEEKKVSG
ncbi:hypothetical protein RRG08_019033 [Elysia crispata]|uniref:Uncharacterized protein n=1 Tax=Elysia crispata TaxID=231223 RepID=A0AAE1A736_9GAST|nr:hypothetical protein RRG08_019033 [Elysia crispata]